MHNIEVLLCGLCFYDIILSVRSQTFPKTNISYPLIHTCKCAYQGVIDVSFSLISIFITPYSQKYFNDKFEVFIFNIVPESTK